MALQVLHHVDEITSLPTGETMESLFVNVDNHVRTVFVRVKGAQADHPVAPSLPQGMTLAEQVVCERESFPNLVQHRSNRSRHLIS
jgi:hypothetical protein